MSATLQPAVAIRPADTILGAQPGRFVPEAAVPTRASMFGPRGCWAQPGGPLVVADTGNHRVLIWRELPEEDGTPPDLVLGQPGFASDARNRGGPVSARSMFVPTGVLVWRGRLLVADAWNHRVLIWRELPRASDVPADLALGQASLGAGELNRGGRPRADTLYWPYGLATDGQRLYVADSNNRRVLVWSALPDEPGRPADLVLGQADFAGGEENAGGAPTAASMRWPHGLASDGRRLLLADAGNNRVLIWDRLPVEPNAPADRALGQPDFVAVSDNRGYRLGAATLRFPYGAALWGGQIVVADTGNSRLLLWATPTPATGAAPDKVFGQADFDQSGENRWKLAGRDTLCWPYGIGAVGGVLAVADSGNNRVLLWHGEEPADE
ncbi:MAG: hypothetical protein HGA45_08620 [Chloroflexales bacterium]|nr:hypothetical protein [Chloroflexales bacterium]